MVVSQAARGIADDLKDDAQTMQSGGHVGFVMMNKLVRGGLTDGRTVIVLKQAKPFSKADPNVPRMMVRIGGLELPGETMHIAGDVGAGKEPIYAWMSGACKNQHAAVPTTVTSKSPVTVQLQPTTCLNNSHCRHCRLRLHEPNRQRPPHPPHNPSDTQPRSRTPPAAADGTADDAATVKVNLCMPPRACAEGVCKECGVGKFFATHCQAWAALADGSEIHGCSLFVGDTTKDTPVTWNAVKNVGRYTNVDGETSRCNRWEPVHGNRLQFMQHLTVTLQECIHHRLSRHMIAKHTTEIIHRVHGGETEMTVEDDFSSVLERSSKHAATCQHPETSHCAMSLHA